jgi:hypothetical protein
MQVPAHIPKPDWAKTGIPAEEEATRQQRISEHLRTAHLTSCHNTSHHVLPPPVPQPLAPGSQHRTGRHCPARTVTATGA